MIRSSRSDIGTTGKTDKLSYFIVRFIAALSRGHNIFLITTLGSSQVVYELCYSPP